MFLAGVHVLAGGIAVCENTPIQDNKKIIVIKNFFIINLLLMFYLFLNDLLPS